MIDIPSDAVLLLKGNTFTGDLDPYTPLFNIKSIGSGIAKTSSVAPREVRNKSLKMVEEHGRDRNGSVIKGGQLESSKQCKPEAGPIVEESEDDLIDDGDSKLSRNEEEAPWVEHIADERAARQVMSDVLERYSVKTERELEENNKMLQHRIRCKA